LENEEGFYDERYIADWETLPNKNTENEELRKILDDAIVKLSPEYRMVFLLRDVEGLSTEDTAKATDLSVPAVKSRLHRARAFLRKEINEAFRK
jgi:RNA polymerase sigma-70 factor (ECF subfamily)